MLVKLCRLVFLFVLIPPTRLPQIGVKEKLGDWKNWSIGSISVRVGLVGFGLGQTESINFLFSNGYLKISPNRTKSIYPKTVLIWTDQSKSSIWNPKKNNKSQSSISILTPDQKIKKNRPDRTTANQFWSIVFFDRGRFSATLLEHPKNYFVQNFQSWQYWLSFFILGKMHVTP